MLNNKYIQTIAYQGARIATQNTARSCGAFYEHTFTNIRHT